MLGLGLEGSQGRLGMKGIAGFQGHFCRDDRPWNQLEFEYSWGREVVRLAGEWVEVRS